MCVCVCRSEDNVQGIDPLSPLSVPPSPGCLTGPHASSWFFCFFYLAFHSPLGVLRVQVHATASWFTWVWEAELRLSGLHSSLFIHRAISLPLFLFWGRVSCLPATHYVAQVVLKHLAVLLQPLRCWDYRHELLHQAYIFLCMYIHTLQPQKTDLHIHTQSKPLEIALGYKLLEL